MPADVQVNAGAGNTLVLRGQQVDVAGDIAAPAGTLLLQARVPADTPATAAPLAVVLRPGAELSVAGLWRNHASRDGTAVGALLPSAVGTVATQNGGSISIQAAQINLSPGSVVDVSGGGNVARNGRVGGGNAGSVNLAADPGLGSTLTSRFDADFSAFAIGNRLLQRCRIHTHLDGWPISISVPRNLYEKPEEICRAVTRFLDKHTTHRDKAWE